MEPDSNPELTIVILGKTGVGKSATGNTILGNPVFESKLSFKPVTKTVCEATGNVFGKQIKVIDTPGILDTTEDISTLCQDLLQSSKPCLFLIVVKVDRFTEEDTKAVRQAMKATEHCELKNRHLLFTGGDVLKEMSLADFIFAEDEGYLPDVVKDMNGQYHLFNNENQDQEQVRSLLMKSGHLTARISSRGQTKMETRIFLLGLPGAGKSSTANTILATNTFVAGCDFNSITKTCTSKSAMVGEQKVTVVDTPGFSDEILAPKDLYLEIMKVLVEASPGPHAFAIVVKLDRVSKSDALLYEMLTKVFDKNASKHSMVIFTHGDKLNGTSITKLIKSNKCVSNLVSMFGNRYCVLNNKQKNSKQVITLLNKIDEVVSDNGGQHYTSDMFKFAEQAIVKAKLQVAPSKSSSFESQDDAHPKPNVWEDLKSWLHEVWVEICEYFQQLLKCTRFC